MSCEQAVQLLAQHEKILIFTGAGLSTGSGIPDFRGPHGAWKRRPPVYFDEFLASEQKRVEYWEYKEEGYEAFSSAQPNAAHQAIVRLGEMGKLLSVVTQNIDGLHQRSGLLDSHLIEVHGTNAWVECVDCGQRVEPSGPVAFFRENKSTPLCRCGGFQKFATISFGQALRPEVLERAAEVAEQADLVVSLGSTLSVHPAASIPLLAARRGAPYIIINRGETDQDTLATVRLEGDVVDILPKLMGKISDHA
jgi:NAD-dependent deacetylase